MSVRRRKRRNPVTGAASEYWMIDIDLHHPDGRRERLRKVSPVNTRRGAEQYERELRQALLDGTYRREEVDAQEQVPQMLTFGAFVEQKWWPTYPKSAGNRPTTIREKEVHLRMHLKPALARLPLDRVRGEVVARLFADLRTKGLSEKSIKNVRTTLHKILVTAREWEVLTAVPPLPRVKVPEPSFDFLTAEEGDLLIKAARNPEERALLLFALRTGARAGEQLAIEWGDIDWHSRKVIFRRSSTKGIVGPTKNGKERKVPLTPVVAEALRAIKHLRGPLIFCNLDGRPMSLWQFHERLWGALRRAGIRKIRWHDLRHSYASRLVAEGVPMRRVQEALGHSTMTMTMRYSHLAPGGDDEMIRALDGAGADRPAEQQFHGTIAAPRAKNEDAPANSQALTLT